MKHYRSSNQTKDEIEYSIKNLKVTLGQIKKKRLFLIAVLGDINGR